MDAAKIWRKRARNHQKRLYGHGRGASHLGSSLHQIFKSRKWVCPYTGQALSLSNVSIDHIVPLSRGGTNKLSNLQFISNQANREKGNQLWNEFNPQVIPQPLSKYA